VETLRFLTPHIRRAFKLHFQLASTRSKSANLLEAVDLVPDAIVFLGHKGQIVSMNAAASAIFSQRDGMFATRDGYLRAEQPDQAAVLTKAIADAVSKSNGASLSGQLSLRVSRSFGFKSRLAQFVRGRSRPTIIATADMWNPRHACARRKTF
jgi:hypothetical protein